MPTPPLYQRLYAYIQKNARTAKISKQKKAAALSSGAINTETTDRSLDAELLQILDGMGCSYDQSQDIFYYTLNTWQRNVGYCRLYDQAAAPLGLIIDCEPIHFEYNNKQWLIEFWKGQYGITTGCEIGVYSTKEHELQIPDLFKGLYYQSASDDELLDMTLTLKKNGKSLFTRKARHWWLTGFILGEFSEPSALSMNLGITFNNKEMLASFVQGLKKAGYSKGEFSIFHHTVNIRFEKVHTPQPYTRSTKTDWVIQRKNKLLCKSYQEIAMAYENLSDKLNAVKQQAPELFDAVLAIGKTQKLFEAYEKIKVYLH